MLRPTSFADYWLKVMALGVLMYAGYLAFGILRLPQGWDLILILFVIPQTVIVYRMLKLVGRSTAIILIFFITMRFGPSLEFGNRELFLSQLIYFLPLIIAGWPRRGIFTPRAAGSA